MINGDLKEFIDGLYYGDERVFVYKGIKYFIQGLGEKDNYELLLDIWEPYTIENYFWIKSGKDSYPVQEFLNEKIFNGKSFLEIENEIKWVD